MNPSLVPTRKAMSVRQLITSGSMPYIICFCAALLFAGLSGRDVWRHHQFALDAIRGTIVPQINASTLLAGRSPFLGNPKSPYTVVEFGDYECPYCRMNEELVTIALDKYKGQIKFDFRQFPLTHIHPYAEAAALAAESGRPTGKFWTIHEMLFATDLSKRHAIDHSLALVGVTPSREIAQKQIMMDAAVAKLLSVNATPSFFLCCPNGSVVRLPRLQAIDLNIKEK